MPRASKRLTEKPPKTEKGAVMRIEQLDRQEVFQFLRPDQVKTISDVAEVVSYQAGDIVYSKGAIADHFYIVLEGQVSLRLPGHRGVSIQIDELTSARNLRIVHVFPAFQLQSRRSMHQRFAVAETRVYDSQGADGSGSGSGLRNPDPDFTNLLPALRRDHEQAAGDHLEPAAGTGSA